MNTRKPFVAMTVVLLLQLLLIRLACYVQAHPLNDADLLISRLIQRHRSLFLDELMYGISFHGSIYPVISMVLITAGVYYFRGYIKEAIFVVLTLQAIPVSYLIKIMVERPRPDSDMIRVIEWNNSASFPSATVAVFVLFLGFNLLLSLSVKKFHLPVRKAIWIVSIPFIFLIGFSRIYLGAHWFTDVIGGMIVGLMLLLIQGWIYLRSGRT